MHVLRIDFSLNHIINIKINEICIEVIWLKRRIMNKFILNYRYTYKQLKEMIEWMIVTTMINVWSVKTHTQTLSRNKFFIRKKLAWTTFNSKSATDRMIKYLESPIYIIILKEFTVKTIKFVIKNTNTAIILFKFITQSTHLSNCPKLQP